MSWASRRKTTRLEDIAYCLLGLFDVNMPLIYVCFPAELLLWLALPVSRRETMSSVLIRDWCALQGEGQKAFIRLQNEIIRTSDDESIFAWTAEPTDQYFGLMEPFQENLRRRSGDMLAPAPSAFADPRDIRGTQRGHLIDRPPYFMTNKGLQFKIPLPMLEPTEPNGQDIEDPSLDAQFGLITNLVHILLTRPRGNTGWTRIALLVHIAQVLTEEDTKTPNLLPQTRISAQSQYLVCKDRSTPWKRDTT